MKTIAIVGLISLLAACGRLGPQREDIPREVCVGKLEKVNGQHLRMICNTGRVINYTSYKYSMTEK